MVTGTPSKPGFRTKLVVFFSLSMALAPAKQFSVQLKNFQLELYFIELNYIFNIAL
ncbi:hypothetical protein EV03_0425 [Prochlorococcus marinus str. PAC1]|uniref:Uncharacterized protein n=4 Tax=Prochlorococcus marinus TaxID=1219 RepID=A7MDB1_PROMT|nr:Hypothetical protein NATL1_02351 [Prochlorococcus marinus str. NATL1A]ABU23849.1 Conserved hypothetical protein [Prochlorococcus marinus str. NATL2A]AJW30336.1 hypothetical protein FA02_0067 [Prochlorococcus marinus str. P0902-H212]KGG21686.1 hypothetical protein EV03_0425 [Prochlorococcus marinus str. PAC1]